MEKNKFMEVSRVRIVILVMKRGVSCKGHSNIFLIALKNRDK